MEKINSGYVALTIVLVASICLQFWWISMTIRNERNEKVFTNWNQTDDIKKRLEKLLTKTD